jgi:hypothetical protein
MKNKGGRPKKDPEELRIKNVMVSFSIDEWEKLQSLMERTGHDAPAVFLRASGLRSRLPAKVFVPEIHRRLQERIIEGVKSIKEMNNEGMMNEYEAGQFLVNLRSIAHDLMDPAPIKRIELMNLEIERLRAILAEQGIQS